MSNRILRFFDYLYYLIYKFYSRKEKGAASTSAGIIGGLLTFNVLTFVTFISFFISEKPYLNKITAIGVFIFFQIITYIRYIYKEKIPIPHVEERWLKLSESRKQMIRGLSFLYIFLSASVFIGFAIFAGSRK